MFLQFLVSSVDSNILVALDNVFHHTENNDDFILVDLKDVIKDYSTKSKS